MSCQLTGEAEAAELPEKVGGGNTNQDLEKQLEVQKLNLEEIGERLTKCEGHREYAQVRIKRLEEKVQEAELELQNHMTKNHVAYYADFKKRTLEYVEGIEVVRNGLESKLKKRDEKLDEIAKVSANLMDDIDELKKSLEKCKKKGDQAAEDLKNCKALVNKLEGSNETSNLSFKSFQTRKELETTIDNLQKRVSELIGAFAGPKRAKIKEPERERNDPLGQRQKVQDLEKKIKDLENKIKELEKNIAKTQARQASVSSAGNGNGNRGNLKLKTLETENVNLQRRLDESEQKVAERDLKIIGMDEDRHTALENLKRRNIENEAISDQLEECEAEVDALKEQQNSTAELATQLKALKSKNTALTGQLREQQISNAELTTKLEALKSQNTTLTGQLQEQRDATAELTTKLAAVQAENTKLTKDLAELQAAHDKLTTRVETADAKVATMTERLEAQGNAGDLKRQLEDLEEGLRRCRSETWEARKVRVAQEAKNAKQEAAAQERKDRNKKRNTRKDGKDGKDDKGGGGGGKEGKSKRGRDDKGGDGDDEGEPAEGPPVKKTNTKSLG